MCAVVVRRGADVAARAAQMLAYAPPVIVMMHHQNSAGMELKLARRVASASGDRAPAW